MKGIFIWWLLADIVVAAILLFSCANRNTGEDVEWGDLDLSEIEMDPCLEISVADEQMERFDMLAKRSAGIRLMRIPTATSVLIGSGVGEDRIHMEKLESICTLSEPELDTLAQILFGYTANVFRYHCYSPRQGILFVDADEKALEFLEICLECNQLRSTRNLQEASVLLCPNQTAA